MTEYEISTGMPTQQDCEHQCLVMLRTIDDLDGHLENPAAAKYVDLIVERNGGEKKIFHLFKKPNSFVFVTSIETMPVKAVCVLSTVYPPWE